MKKTGGQAFPMHWSTKEANINVVLEQRGMTLRDYFAAKALQGLCAGFCSHDRNWPRDDEPEGYEVAAQHSYQMADAMLKAREA